MVDYREKFGNPSIYRVRVGKDSRLLRTKLARAGGGEGEKVSRAFDCESSDSALLFQITDASLFRGEDESSAARSCV